MSNSYIQYVMTEVSVVKQNKSYLNVGQEGFVYKTNEETVKIFSKCNQKIKNTILKVNFHYLA